jgi:hypothetical protein
MRSKVLMLNRDGQPNGWITQEEAILYHATEKVIYQIGRDDQFIFRGGVNRLTNKVSQLATAPIIAVDGATKDKSFKVPTITNRVLFQRDNHQCAYCGRKFGYKQLTRDHVLARSRGGKDRWDNIVACCAYHNNMKDNLTPEEAGLKLIFQPYTPTFAEVLFLEQAETSLPIQVEYLVQFFPEQSRIINRALELM